MTNPTQPKPNPVPAILVYGTPSGPALTQASWFQAEDKEAVKAAAEALKFSVIELHTDAEKALAAGVDEGVLKGSGRMIVASVATEVYRRIQEYGRKGARASDPSQPESATSPATKTASEQTMKQSGPARLSTAKSDPRQHAQSLGRVAGRRAGPGRLLEREARIRGLLACHRQADRARQMHARVVRRARISGVQDRTEKRRHPASRVPRLGQVARE